MKLKHTVYLATLSLFAMGSSIVMAHPSLGSDVGLADGLMHPFTGVDHLLAMVAVGIWAGQLGGKAIWMVPITFIGIMFAAANVGALGIPVPMLGSGLGCSVLVLGLIVATTVRLPMVAVCGIVGLFAFCHGYMHGAELLEVDSPVYYETGFLSATVFLHGLGIGIGHCRRLRYYVVLQRLSGLSLMVASGLLLAT